MTERAFTPRQQRRRQRWYERRAARAWAAARLAVLLHLPEPEPEAAASSPPACRRPEPPKRWKLVNMKLPLDALARIDAEARRLGMSRTGYVIGRCDPNDGGIEQLPRG